MAHCSYLTPIQPATIPAEGPYVVTEAANAHAMYLDGQLIGFARTHDDGNTTLDQLEAELLSGQYTAPSSAPTLPLPPTDTIAEALGVLAAHDNEPAIYADACSHLAAGVNISADGDDRLIDGVRVHRAPPLESWP